MTKAKKDTTPTASSLNSSDILYRDAVLLDSNNNAVSALRESYAQWLPDHALLGYKLILISSSGERIILWPPDVFDLPTAKSMAA